MDHDRTVAENKDASQVLDRWEELVNAGHVDEIMARFSDDAIWCNAEEGIPVIGREAIQDKTRAVFAWARARNSLLEIRQVEILGNWGYLTASFSATWSEPGGHQVEERSRYVLILKRESAGWRIWSFCFMPESKQGD